MEYIVFMLILVSIILNLVCIYLKILVNDLNNRVNEIIDILSREV